MLAGIVIVLVLLNSYPIYSIDDSIYANFDEVIPAILMKETGMSLFDTILKNLPSNQNNYESSHATNYTVDTCLRDLMQIQAQLQNLDINALRMVDAWGKIPFGILTGNFYEFGSFDECFDVQIRRKNTDEFIHPQYCLAKVSILFGEQTMFSRLRNIQQFQRLESFNLFPRMATLQSESPTISINTGICIPASCSPQFFEGILSAFLNESLPSLVPTVDVSPEWCQLEKNASEFTTIDIVTITILSVTLYLIIMSTLYEIVCTMNKKKKREIFLVFSALSNGRKIFYFQSNKSPDVISCLDGIRAISTAYIIFGHSYYMHTVFPTKNKIAFIVWMTHYSSTLIYAAPLSVETFFVLSGFLVTLVLLKRLEKSNGHLNIFEIYLHRYIRLTPLLAIIILYQSSLIRFFGSGPIWAPMVDETRAVCERDWWKSLLYVHNLDSTFNICLPHTWYLSVDMQLFVVAPLIAYLLYQFKLKFMVLVVLLIFGSFGSGFYTFLFVEGATTSKFIQLIYFPTYVRMMTWLVGVVLGYFVFHTRNRRIYIPKAINVLGWVVSISSLAVAILTIYLLMHPKNKPSVLDEALYNNFSRLLWAVAICYIIFACVHGYGGPINWFLSLELWQPFSRLSYAIYLVHYVVMTIYNGSMKDAPFFSDGFAIYKFFAYYTLAFLVATLASLAFESPIVALEILLRSKTNPKSDKTVT